MHQSHLTTVADLQCTGGSGGSLKHPSGNKLFQFRREIYEKSGKVMKTNTLLMNLKSPSKNPESASKQSIKCTIVDCLFRFLPFINDVSHSSYLENNKISIFSFLQVNISYSLKLFSYPEGLRFVMYVWLCQTLGQTELIPKASMLIHPFALML